MVKIDINISNRTFILIGILFVIVIFGGIVIAGNPAVFGHNLGDVAVPSGCTSGQFIKYNGTGLECATPSSGGSLSCYTTYNTCSDYWCTASCNSGYKAISGGMANSGSVSSFDNFYPLSYVTTGAEGWYGGAWGSVPTTVYVMCCKIV